MQDPIKKIVKAKIQPPAEVPAKMPEDAAPPTAAGFIPLPSTDPATNFLIADIILRAAGDFARERIEKTTLSKTYNRETAEEIVSSQSIGKTIALYGMARLARRSPAGLALVAGGLVLKALYDRGKNLEKAKRPRRKRRGK
ncbi:MAG: hypothetical protein ACXIT4_05765 [Erythrobacter sp.]